jgi:hypothetical protein
MNEAKPIAVHTVHYQVTATVGLGMTCLGLYWQGVDFLNIFLGLVGGWMILFPRPRVPLVFLLFVCVVQVHAHFEEFRSFRFTPSFQLFEPTTVVLASGLLIFFCSQYRVLALKWHVTPYDPRFTRGKTRDESGRPSVPQTRPEAAIGPDEIVRLVVNTALCVIFGQLGWHWLSQTGSVAGLQPPFMQIAILIWFGITGLFVGAGIAGYWRRAHSEPDLAKLYLQEVDWREARREYARIGRWIAWGKQKVARKKRG